MRHIITYLIIMFLFQLSGCITGRSIIIQRAAELDQYEGRRVVIQGSVAKEIWQHMVAPSRDYPRETYFDLDDVQIVVYSKTAIQCPGMVRAAGTVIKLEGSSKDPRRKESVTEYHVNVDSWECLPR